jgi:hypothetical protein
VAASIGPRIDQSLLSTLRHRSRKTGNIADRTIFPPPSCASLRAIELVSVGDKAIGPSAFHAPSPLIPYVLVKGERTGPSRKGLKHEWLGGRLPVGKFRRLGPKVGEG